MIMSQIWKAISYLFFAAIITYIYNTAVQSKDDWKKLLGKGFMWCAGASFILAMLLGKPTCLQREEDGMGGTCIEYADDGFEATDEQYIAEFAFYFTLSFIPVLVAVNEKRKVEEI